MKKWTKLMLASSLAVGVLAACGPQDEGASSEGSSNEKPEKLIVWEDQDKGKALEAAADKFTEDTGIEIEYKEYNITEIQENLALDGNTSNAPDVVTMSHDGIGPSVTKGYLQELDIDDETKALYTESSMDAMTYKDKVYGLPKAVETTVFIYNKDKLAEAPETMDEVYEVSKEAVQEDGQYGFLSTWDNFYFSHGVFHGFGSYVFGEGDDASDIGLNNESAVEALNYIDKWYDEGLFPSGLLGENASDVMSGQFNDGNAVAVQNGPWAFKDYEENGINIGVSPMPKLPNGERQGTYMGVKGWFVTSFAAQNGTSEYAQQFVEYITNAENAKARYEMTAEIPPLKELIEDEAWVSENPYAAAVMEQSKFGIAMPAIPEMAEVWEPMATAVSTTATDKAEAQEALDDAVNVINQQIEANHSGN
ncbi:cyclodextrin-binding protein [Pontibacillus halophilus JSM 076056 = DSM 19796]|uniref:Maltodextrin-binding protein n=1 Tax=Pontibacillus halophilus JSM 076056 = DSM 19796 TaxID=1385510 RepID=A0A0A5GNB1_9BACI|nr:extracellular solute-binding protein [Pontibacillus halophilus]KGX92650.1 cyclodextrin-binding protein [Pontibacillus halophilus JSM 076056 = DSM 19796]